VIVKEYHAEPTLARLHLSLAVFKYVEGPVGSGKSTGCIMDLLRMGMEQQPDSHGIRKTRWAIIRATNPQLRSTTIKTFEMWIPPEVAPVVYTAPINSRLRQRLADGTICDIEFIFIALDEPEDVRKLTSLELTGAYINEGREIEHTHVETLQGRIGRYPQTVKDKDTGKVLYGPTHIKIIMDSNPPKTTHWIFDTFHTGNTPEGYEIFTQPPAVYWDEKEEKWVMNPDAENLSHLPDGYYERQLKGATDEYIRVMLAGECGMTVAGKPVFPSYSERRHVSPVMLNPIRGYPIIAGIDFGLMPAVVLGQLTHKGFRVTDELPATDESLEDFLTEYLAPLLAARYPGYPIIGSGDPAGRGRSGLDKRTPFDVLIAAGIKAFPAYTNNFITRKETVEWFLRRDEGLLISPHCTVLREGFAGGYIYKLQRNNTGRHSERPDKNEYSHPMDALQYALLQAKYGSGHTKAAPDREPPKYLYA
jgi:hypothetical protein